jgi:hypothetical protein
MTSGTAEASAASALAAAALTVAPQAALEPQLNYDAGVDVELRVSKTAHRATVVVHGNATFDAAQVHRDILSIDDWWGTTLARIPSDIHMKVADLDRDGLTDVRLRFSIHDADDRAAILDDIYDGHELCLRGVTMDGVTSRAARSRTSRAPGATIMVRPIDRARAGVAGEPRGVRRARPGAAASHLTRPAARSRRSPRTTRRRPARRRRPPG